MAQVAHLLAVARAEQLVGQHLREHDDLVVLSLLAAVHPTLEQRQRRLGVEVVAELGAEIGLAQRHEDLRGG
eukprot:scaffold1147_cov68-Phaeocystis_antarctica.AAC.11